MIIHLEQTNNRMLHLFEEPGLFSHCHLKRTCPDYLALHLDLNQLRWVFRYDKLFALIANETTDEQFAGFNACEGEVPIGIGHRTVFSRDTVNIGTGERFSLIQYTPREGLIESTSLF